ncbi:MAG: hypothetical protein J1F35_03285 [Erysipelotrichales bacterium]|nr:hypothetical protein [Erysipelotrichales bacterium]
MKKFLDWLDKENENLERWLSLQSEIENSVDEIGYEYAKYSLEQQLNDMDPCKWN